jgi:flagellin
VDLLASAQTLTFTTDGAQDSIAIAATDTAATIAQSINNNISGFTAKAVTGARVSFTGTTVNGTLDMKINGVDLTQTAAGSNVAVATNVASLINADVALSKQLTAVDNGDGTLDIFDATGDNIVIDDLTGTRTLGVQALDATGALSGSAQAITSGHGTIAMGDLLLSVDDTTKTYSVHSSVGTGITSATAAGNGVGTVSSTTTTTSAVSAVDISTVAGATSALTSIDAALTSLDSERASLGAVQNRFDSVISNLSNVSENTSAARSRIMDADFAAETAQLAKTQILQQAGISVLAQANAQPQNILALLQ